jgi:hypothetical protein
VCLDVTLQDNAKCVLYVICVIVGSSIRAQLLFKDLTARLLMRITLVIVPDLRHNTLQYSHTRWMLLLSVVSTLRVQRSGEEQEHRLPSAVEGFRVFYRPDSIPRAGLVGVRGKASKPTDEVHSLQGQRLK